MSSFSDLLGSKEWRLLRWADYIGQGLGAENTHIEDVYAKISISHSNPVLGLIRCAKVG